MRKYKGIDTGRLIFACLIIFLHIGMKGQVVDFIRQYLSRIGVPFFYAIAGMFLFQSVEKNGGAIALKKYSMKIGKILIIWLTIYFPILLLREEGVTIREILFKTPAYLWYMTGLLVASIPFCLIQNRKALLCVSVVGYIFGTLFGASYSWVIGGFPAYESVFLTTRNGLFFGLPLMCIGEATWNKEKVSGLETIIAGVMLFVEITFVGLHISEIADRSMYFTLPGFIYFLVIIFRNWNPRVNTTYFGGISSAIYLMQFGVITVVMKVAETIGIVDEWIYYFAYMSVILIPTVFYLIFRKSKVVKMIF